MISESTASAPTGAPHTDADLPRRLLPHWAQAHAHRTTEAGLGPHNEKGPGLRPGPPSTLGGGCYAPPFSLASCDWAFVRIAPVSGVYPAAAAFFGAHWLMK